MLIVVNNGHTLKNAGSGAVGIINESSETRNVGNALMTLLKNAGHQVINATVDSASTQSAYLKETVRIANKQKADLFISIHFNAGGGQGVEAYTYEGKQHSEALNVCSSIAELGFKNRGVKDGSNLYVIKNTKAKAILIECCFVDTDDANKYKTLGSQKIAEAICKGLIGTVPVAPEQPAKPTSGYTGGSIVDYLKSIGKDSSFTARKEYAKQYGIVDYKGTEAQNIALLNAMRGGSTAQAPTVAYYPSFNSGSIVDGLKSIGVDSSYENRKRIAQANGISNYEGQASQNEHLCNLARQGKLKK